MNPIKGIRSRPWRVVIYGTPGIGKSTLASKIPNHLFLDIEDGLAGLDCTRSDVIKTYDQSLEWLRWSIRQPDIGTIVLDTIDGFEKILISKILKESGKKSLADFGYGKGFDKLQQLWVDFFDVLEQFAKFGKNVLLLGHEQVKKYEDPANDGYDRYIIQIQPKSAQIIFNRCDAVLFAKWETHVRTNDSDKSKGIGTGKRLLFCQETPALMAKNRFNLRPVEPMDLEGSIFNKLSFGVK